MEKYLYLLYMYNFTSYYYEEKTNIWIVIFKNVQDQYLPCAAMAH